MGFTVSPELESTLEVIRKFMREEVFPLEEKFLNRPLLELLPEIKKKQEQVRKLGLLSPHIPKDVGGGGFPFLQFARMSEEMGKSPMGLLIFNAQAPDAGNMELMHKHCNDEQRERFLKPVVRAEMRSCFTMTEPDTAGSNPVLLSANAVRDGDDYVINGRKWFSTGIDGSGFAITMVVTNPDAPPHERATMIFVPTDNPGLKILRNISVMGETGNGFFSHSEIEYVNCRVPVANRLGGEGQGFKLAQDRLGPGRIHHCMRWIGICERALSMMIERARTREIAPGKMLGEMQTIQNWIAEARAEIDAARLLVLAAAEKIDRDGAYAARVEISCIKFFVPDILLRTIDRAIQTYGARGLTEDTVLAWWYRHERGARIYDGPDEVHKSVVARQLLKRAH